MIGWPEEVHRLGRLEAQDFYNHHYAPNNAILIVAGDVTADEVRNDAQAAYAKVPARELVARSAAAEPPRLAETRLAVARSRCESAAVHARIPRAVLCGGCARTGEALEVLAQLLGGDYSSTLYRSSSSNAGSRPAPGASYDGYRRDAAEFTVYAYPRPGVSFAQLERAIDDIIASYSKAPNVKELTRAKTQLVAGATYRRDSSIRWRRHTDRRCRSA